MTYVALAGYQKYIHEWAKGHGFWDDKCTNLSQKLMLAVGELSEANEALRKGIETKDAHCPDFRNFDIELADAMIRIMDLAEYCGVDLESAIQAKMAYNQSRPYKHGKQF